MVAACASSSNLILTPNTSSYRTTTATLIYGGGTIDVEEDSVKELKHYMREEFFLERDPLFSEGPGMRVEYGFMQFDEGSQAARYFLGFVGGGDAEMVVRVRFYDPDGNLLAEIQPTGRVSGGLLGGDAGSALRNIAIETATFAEQNFAQ